LLAAPGTSAAEQRSQADLGEQLAPALGEPAGTTATRTLAPAASREAAAEAERLVAWLRLPAIALLALSEGLPHPNPHDTAFLVVLVAFSAWSAGVLAWVYLRPAAERFALTTTAVDIGAISSLVVLSGGPFSHARLAFFVVPVAVAFRFRASITAAAAVVTTTAYLVLAFAHPASSAPQATRFILIQAGFLAWVGLACAVLSFLLGQRTRLVGRLADQRSRLLADALDAEQRERKALAEALHDHALQNLLSARHELEEAAEASAHPALRRADEALAQTVGQLREAVFDLHPYVLEEAGLEAALRSIARQMATHANLMLELDLGHEDRHPREPLLFSAARELLSNVVQHAEASRVGVRLRRVGDSLELAVEDDGRGFAPEYLAERVAEGHVGLASQRVRVEAAGGAMRVVSSPGEGTRVLVRLPV
jgi:two-component system NarL family sensor kinase